MFVPFDRPLDWRNPPLATLVLILLNLGFFVAWQNGDAGRLHAALDYYAESELPRLEANAYLRYVRATRGVPAALSAESELAATGFAPEHVYTQLLADAAFIDDLRANRVIRPQTAEFQRWRSARDEFEGLLDRVVSYRFGLVPSAPRVESMVLSMFLHASWAHLLGNMLFLLLFGYVVEVVIGRPTFLIGYLCAGLVSSLAYIALFSHSSVPSVGASGAVSGVVGMYTALFGLRRIRFFYWVGVFFDYVRAPAVVLLPLWLAYELLLQVFDPSSVNRVAHIAGLLAGAVLALGAKRFLPGVDFGYLNAHEQNEQREQRHREGLRLIAEMELDKARAVFDGLLRDNPDDRRALHQLYNIQRFDPQSDDYHAIAHRILALPARDAPTGKLVHDTYRDYVALLGARTRFTPSGLALLAARFAQSGFLGEAKSIVEHLLRAEAQCPELAATITVLTNAYRRSGDQETSGQLTQQLLHHFPESAQAESVRRASGAEVSLRPSGTG